HRPGRAPDSPRGSERAAPHRELGDGVALWAYRSTAGRLIYLPIGVRSCSRTRPLEDWVRDPRQSGQTSAVALGGEGQGEGEPNAARLAAPGRVAGSHPIATQPVQAVVLRGLDGAEAGPGGLDLLPVRQRASHDQDDVAALAPGQRAGGAA